MRGADKTAHGSAAEWPDHGNVVGNELSDGDAELARAESVFHKGLQGCRGHSILHAAQHVLPVLLTGLGQTQHLFQLRCYLVCSNSMAVLACFMRDTLAFDIFWDLTAWAHSIKPMMVDVIICSNINAAGMAVSQTEKKNKCLSSTVQLIDILSAQGTR